MTESSPILPAPPERARGIKKWSAVLLLALLAGAGVYLHFTHRGLAEQWKDQALAWARANPRGTPLLLAGLYVACGLLLLPVWWVQLLAGTLLGFLPGTVLCTALAAATAALSTTISKSFAREWFEKKIEARVGTLHTLAEKIGHAGVRAVLIVRLTHVVPFGLSNYAFGLLGVPRRAVVVGTLLGSLPTIAFYAAVGASRLRSDWKALAALAALNAALLAAVWLTGGGKGRVVSRES